MTRLDLLLGGFLTGCRGTEDQLEGEKKKRFMVRVAARYAKTNTMYGFAFRWGPQGRDARSFLQRFLLLQGGHGTLGKQCRVCFSRAVVICTQPWIRQFCTIYRSRRKSCDENMIS
jgi:hypothetical protein